MAYSTDLRRLAIEHAIKTKNISATARLFGISLSTLNRWFELQETTGSVDKRPLNRSHKKIDPIKLKELVATNPDAYLRELCEHFDCSTNCMSKALKRLKITRKKRQPSTGKDVKKDAQIIALK